MLRSRSSKAAVVDDIILRSSVVDRYTKLRLCHAVHCKQGKGTEADSLYGRAIEIGEKALGADHPDVAILFNNKGVALSYQVRAVRIF